MPSIDDPLFLGQENYIADVFGLFPELNDVDFLKAYGDSIATNEGQLFGEDYSFNGNSNEEVYTPQIMPDELYSSSLQLSNILTNKQGGSVEELELSRQNIQLMLDDHKTQLHQAKANKETLKKTISQDKNAYRRARDRVKMLEGKIDYTEKQLLLIELKLERERRELTSNFRCTDKRKIFEFDTNKLAKLKSELEQIKLNILLKDEELKELTLNGITFKDAKKHSVWQERYRLIKKMNMLEIDVNILEMMVQNNSTPAEPKVQINNVKMQINPIPLQEKVAHLKAGEPSKPTFVSKQSSHETSRKKRTAEWQSQMGAVIAKFNRQHHSNESVQNAVNVDQRKENCCWLPSFSNVQAVESVFYQPLENHRVEEMAMKRKRSG